VCVCLCVCVCVHSRAESLRIPPSDLVAEHNAILTQIWSFSHYRIRGESFDKAKGTAPARDD
jgi:hypothetical protein